MIENMAHRLAQAPPRPANLHMAHEAPAQPTLWARAVAWWIARAAPQVECEECGC